MERYISPKEAQLLFATSPPLDTIRQWMKVGIHNRMVKSGSKNTRIKLRSIREGSLWFTTPQWVADFKVACENNVKGGRR